MANSADPDQLASNWSGSTLFAKAGISAISRTKVKLYALNNSVLMSYLKQLTEHVSLSLVPCWSDKRIFPDRNNARLVCGDSSLSWRVVQHSSCHHQSTDDLPASEQMNLRPSRLPGKILKLTRYTWKILSQLLQTGSSFLSDSI